MQEAVDGLLDPTAASLAGPPGGVEMVCAIAEDIKKQLKAVRGTCAIIGAIVLAIAALVALLWAIAICTLIRDVETQNGMRFIAFLYSASRNSIIIAVLVIASRVFRDAGCAMTPFSSKQTSRLRAVAVLLMLLVVVDACFIVDYRDALDVFGLQVDVVIATTSSLNIPALVLAAVAFCMSIIFQYGALLQEDEDALA